MDQLILQRILQQKKWTFIETHFMKLQVRVFQVPSRQEAVTNLKSDDDFHSLLRPVWCHQLSKETGRRQLRFEATYSCETTILVRALPLPIQVWAHKKSTPVIPVSPSDAAVHDTDMTSLVSHKQVQVHICAH